MSRTVKQRHRNIFDTKLCRTQSDHDFSPNRIPAYAPKGFRKFVVEPSDGFGITKLGKLVRDNANRSLKKIVRREAKQDIAEQLS